MKCIHSYGMCGYCKLCTGYFEPEPINLDEGAENQLCPTGAIKREVHRGSLLRIQYHHGPVRRLRQVREGLQHVRQRLAVPAGEPRPLRELQHLRDRDAPVRRRRSSRSRPPSPTCCAERGRPANEPRFAAGRIAALFLLAGLDPAFGVERFPPPDFTSHALPETVVPAPQPRGTGWLDVAVLDRSAWPRPSWLSLKSRSRRGIVILSLVSLAYFGFWRRGCVCAIGSIQNVALGIADPGYAVPLAVIAFFTLPLVVALVWGRGFCAGVCPHGAIQDLVLVKPLKVPAWLDEILRVLPWIHLALAVLLAATGSLFIICKFDPFVGIFRMAGPRSMLIAGAGLLVLSMFVGRPYCRYLCPYGALLGVAARFAKWRPTVTPDTCTQCRLCENSCPFGALSIPPSPLQRPITHGGTGFSRCPGCFRSFR